MECPTTLNMWLLRAGDGSTVRIGSSRLILGRKDVPTNPSTISREHTEVLDCGGLLTVSTLSKQKSTHIYQAATGDWVSVAPQSTEFIREGDAIGMCFGEKHFTVAKEATTAVQPPAEFRGLSRSSDEPCPPSKQRRLSSAEPTLVVVLGYQGAGKSTLVRKLIDMVPALDWTVVLGGSANPGDTSRLERIKDAGRTVVFGKWHGFHPDGNSTFAGRLDGCDRTEISEQGLHKLALPRLVQAGAMLIIADGAKVLNGPFVEAAQATPGLRLRLVELDVAPAVAAQRQLARDGPGGKPCDWEKKRTRWTSHPNWETMPPATLLQMLKQQLLGAACPANSPPGNSSDDDHGDLSLLQSRLEQDAASRATCSAYPARNHLCKYDGACYSRDVRHWARFAHPCELSKPYCPQLLSGQPCFNRNLTIHNGQYSHGPLPSAMCALAAPAAVSPLLPSSSLGSDHSPLAPLKRQLESLLWQHREALFTSQHRTGAAFSLAGSFKVGSSCNVFFLDKVRNGDPRYLQHPTKNTGVYIVPPAAQLAQGKVTPLQWAVYEPAVKLIERLDPEYAAGEYVVQFAYMNQASHFVKCHVDNDVSFQYSLTLGDFCGASLRAYTTVSKSAHVDFTESGRIVQFDGRLPHEVVSDGFRGDRFTVIWCAWLRMEPQDCSCKCLFTRFVSAHTCRYKNYDHRKQACDDPLLETPLFVDESRLRRA